MKDKDYKNLFELQAIMRKIAYYSHHPADLKNYIDKDQGDELSKLFMAGIQKLEDIFDD